MFFVRRFPTAVAGLLVLASVAQHTATVHGSEGEPAADHSVAQSGTADRAPRVPGRGAALRARDCSDLGWVRGAHMGGNWGTNVWAAAQLPESYFAYLKGIHVNWAGMHVEVFVRDSMDARPQPRYSGVQHPTFSDDVIVGLVRAFHAHGIKVHLSYGINDRDSMNAIYPARGWQLGDARALEYDPTIDAAHWPWAMDYPQHVSFVRQFWHNYSRWAVYFARIAQQEGVEMFALGGENTGLFRTRTGETWPNDFRRQLRSMVRKVRRVYDGALTYDMNGPRLTPPDATGAMEMWADLDLDVIAMTAHFTLVHEAPLGVMGVGALKRAWKRIFRSTLIPLRRRFPDKPIVWAGGYGITDSIRSPYQVEAEEGEDMVLRDDNGNGLDDGQETQRNFHEALYRVMERNPWIIQGGMLWGEMMSSDQDWAASFGKLRGFHVRSKLADQVVRDWFGKWEADPPDPGNCGRR